MPNRMEEMASKAAGAMKAAKATFKGLSGVFKQLTQEHGEVSALLMRLKMTSEADVRRELFPKIRRELLSHEKGELSVVYPVFRQHPELESIAKSHDAEASQLERTLDELSAMSYEDGAWRSKFATLVDLVSHHTKEEENEYFPTANRLLGDDEAERMKIRYEQAKAQAMQQTS